MVVEVRRKRMYWKYISLKAHSLDSFFLRPPHPPPRLIYINKAVLYPLLLFLFPVYRQMLAYSEEASLVILYMYVYATLGHLTWDWSQHRLSMHYPSMLEMHYEWVFGLWLMSAA